MSGLESIITTSAGNISNLVLTKLLGVVDSDFGGRFKERQYEGIKELIYVASLKYISNYIDRHGILKVLGMHQPIYLDSIYTTVNFLSEGSIRSFTSIETLEQVFRQSRGRSFQFSDQLRKSGIVVANQNQYLMILGSPGSGKSTFLRKVGLEALKGKQGEYRHDCIPVFLELKRFSSSNFDIRQLITEEFEVCGFPYPDKIVGQGLDQGRLLILLDSLDEVPSNNLDPITERIQDFVDRYSRNRFIVSSRIAAYRGGWRRFIDVVISDFDERQIQQFIRQWFQSALDQQMGTAEKFWQTLQSPENAAIKELAQAPLLLTLLCLAYDRTQKLPHNRSALYSKVLDILLEDWAAEKRIRWQPIFQGLTPELEKVLLSEIAYRGFESNQFFFSEEELLQQVKCFLVDNLSTPEYIDSNSVLTAIVLQQGVLVERAVDVYSFSHLTLQEYLSALYIRDHQQIESLVSQHLTDELWHEIFLIVAGLIYRGADELLLQMEKRTQEYIKTPRLRNLLHWADQATNEADDTLGAASKRAMAIYLVRTFSLDSTSALDPIRTLAFDLAQRLDREITQHINTASFNVRSLAFASSLKNAGTFKSVDYEKLITNLELLQTEASSQSQISEMPQDFAQRCQKAWLDAFHLNSDLIELSDDEVATMAQYLRTYILIVRCKYAAVRVSKRTWETIVERMLLPLRL